MTLIDDLDDKLSVIELQSKSANKKILPQLPDAIADVRDKSFDERFAELNRVPLFMRELDETDGKDGENRELEALKSLAYEGEPWEVATSFKENGNESFRAKEYKDAIQYYTKALQLKCGRDDIDEICHVNRAACNLELQNYGKVLADCSKALKINPRNLKALYRSARACIAVDRLDEAQDVLERGLLLDPENVGLKQQLAALEKKLKAALDKRQREDERRHKESTEARNIVLALSQRNIIVTKSSRPPDAGDGKICLSDPADSMSALVFPTVFLYPLAYQSDFLAAFAEVYTIQSQLDIILEQPPPWDERRQYTPKNVECYMETKTGGLIKLGKKAELGAALGSGKVEVKDGIVRIFVLPKSESAAWIEQFKKEKAMTGGR